MCTKRSLAPPRVRSTRHSPLSAFAPEQARLRLQSTCSPRHQKSGTSRAGGPAGNHSHRQMGVPSASWPCVRLSAHAAHLPYPCRTYIVGAICAALRASTSCSPLLALPSNARSPLRPSPRTPRPLVLRISGMDVASWEGEAPSVRNTTPGFHQSSRSLAQSRTALSRLIVPDSPQNGHEGRLPHGQKGSGKGVKRRCSPLIGTPRSCACLTAAMWSRSLTSAGASK